MPNVNGALPLIKVMFQAVEDTHMHSRTHTHSLSHTHTHTRTYIHIHTAHPATATPPPHSHTKHPPPPPSLTHLEVGGHDGGEDLGHGVLAERVHGYDVEVAQEARGDRVATAAWGTHGAQEQDVLQDDPAGVL